MPHTITYNSKESVIEINIQGDLFLNEIKEIVTEVIQIAKEQNCLLVLNDMRESTMQLSIVEIYELPKIILDISVSLGLDVRKFKRAFVAEKDLKDYDFFETVTFNRGQHAKLFDDVDEAKKWLFGK
jgi:hypothetical protein